MIFVLDENALLLQSNTLEESSESGFNLSSWYFESVIYLPYNQ